MAGKIYVSPTKLPNEYQEVEYLETDGNAYIQTTYQPGIKTKTVAVFSNVTGGTTPCALFGAMDTDTEETSQYWAQWSGESEWMGERFLPAIGGSASGFSVSTDPEGELFTFEIGDYTVSGSRETVTCKVSYGQTSESISLDIWDNSFVKTTAYGAIFTVKNTNGVWDTIQNGLRLHSYKTYNYSSGSYVLARDYIPCYRKADNKPGLFDLVHQVFYTNASNVAGSEFICGNAKKLPDAYQRVEYLESTGTQYIDTGVIQNSDQMAMEITFRLTSNTYSNSGWLMGCWDTSKAFAINVNKNSGDAAKKMVIGIGSAYWSTSSAIDLNTHIYKNDMANLTAYMDNVPYTVSTFTRTINNLHIYIFFGDETGTGDKTIGKCYGAKIWDAGLLIHDYYPCYRKADNKPGLYDIVTNTFLINASSDPDSEFICGPAISAPQSIAYLVSKIYAGVNGTAREVKRVYAGINGVAKLIYPIGTLIHIPTMTSNTAPSGKASASSQYNNTTRVPFMAFDKNSSSFWTQASDYQSKSGQYIQYDFGYSINPTKVTARTTGGDGAKTIRFDACANGSSTWNTLCTMNMPNSTSVVTVDISTSNMYRYFRWVVTAFYSSGWTRLAELDVYGMKY